MPTANRIIMLKYMIRAEDTIRRLIMHDFELDQKVERIFTHAFNEFLRMNDE